MKGARSKHPGDPEAETSSNWDMKKKRYSHVTVKCEFCGESFNTNSSYQDHALQEHGDKMKATWLKCSQCDSLLPTKLSLVTHKAKIHGNAELRDANGNYQGKALLMFGLKNIIIMASLHHYVVMNGR